MKKDWGFILYGSTQYCVTLFSKNDVELIVRCSFPPFQISTMVDLTSFDFQFEEFVPDRDDLKKILHHQKYRQKLTQSKGLFTNLRI